MKTIKRNNGNDIKIYATTLDDVAFEQIKELGEFEPYQDSKIRIMPDCHAGAGCTIGTTMEIKDKITPNLVGVDIGCGMLTVKLNETNIDLRKLDSVINEFVPNGFNIHSEPKAYFEFDKLLAKNLNIGRAKLSIGSLGGGNHFIEVGKNSKGELFLVIHSGSRNIGGQVARYYQDIAIENLTDNSKEREELIERLKKEGKQNEIGEELKKLKKPIINKDLAYLTGSDFDNYMHDMELMQKFAVLNRRTMANIVLEKTGLTEVEAFETIHNYIDFKRMILRKGAVSAENGETLLIPINMRDGSIIAKGKGNEDWNYSAPHGAGRLMGRNEAHKKLNFEEFKEQCMRNFSACIHMRDENMNKEYEPRIPSDYHTKALEKAKEKLKQAETFTDAELIEMRTKELEESKKYHLESIAKTKIARARLEEFLAKAIEFKAPTPEHEGLRKFMIEQLQSTIDFDGKTDYHDKALPEIEMELKNIDANQIRSSMIADANKDIAYHLKNHKEELKRCAESNAWVEMLLSSLACA